MVEVQELKPTDLVSEDKKSEGYSAHFVCRFCKETKPDKEMHEINLEKGDGICEKCLRCDGICKTREGTIRGGKLGN